MNKLIDLANFLLFVSLMSSVVLIVMLVSDLIGNTEFEFWGIILLSILGLLSLFYIILGVKQIVAYYKHVLSLKIKGGVFGVNPVLKTILDLENAVVVYEVPTKVRVEGIHNDEDGRLSYAFTVRCYVRGEIRVCYFNKRGDSWEERKRWKFQETQTESFILGELEPVLATLRKI